MALSDPTRVDDERSADSILTDPHRRYVLDALRETDLPMSVADLATDIAADERGTARTDPDWERIDRIYVSLYHNHLPKLAERGLVEFDSERKVVSLSERRSRTRDRLEVP